MQNKRKMRSPAGLDSYLCLFLRSRRTNATTVRIREPSLPPTRMEPREGLCLADELPLLSLRHRSLLGPAQKPGLGASSSCRGNDFSAQRQHHAMQRQPEEVAAARQGFARQETPLNFSDWFEGPKHARSV